MFGTYVPAAQRRPEARIMSINRKYHISNLDDSESWSPVQQEQFDDSTSGALPSNGNSQANIQVDMSGGFTADAKGGPGGGGGGKPGGGGSGLVTAHTSGDPKVRDAKEFNNQVDFSCTLARRTPSRARRDD